MNKYHEVTEVKFQDEKFVLTVDDKECSFELSDISQKLSKASKLEREKFEISPSGYGIHWPLLDEDLSIDGLLGIAHSPSPKAETVSR